MLANDFFPLLLDFNLWFHLFSYFSSSSLSVLQTIFVWHFIAKFRTASNSETFRSAEPSKNRLFCSTENRHRQITLSMQTVIYKNAIDSRLIDESNSVILMMPMWMTATASASTDKSILLSIRFVGHSNVNIHALTQHWAEWIDRCVFAYVYEMIFTTICFSTDRKVGIHCYVTFTRALMDNCGWNSIILSVSVLPYSMSCTPYGVEMSKL